MSVVLEATAFGTKMNVEIFHDGSMEFLDHDIQHDAAAHEFGYPKTEALRLYEHWQEVPIHVITYNLLKSSDWKILARLLIDWAEHVLPVFEKSLPALQAKLGYSEYTPEQPFGPRLAIEKSKHFLIHARPEDPGYMDERTELQHAEFEAKYWETVARQRDFNAAAEAASDELRRDNNRESPNVRHQHVENSRQVRH